MFGKKAEGTTQKKTRAQIVKDEELREIEANSDLEIAISKYKATIFSKTIPGCSLSIGGRGVVGQLWASMTGIDENGDIVKIGFPISAERVGLLNKELEKIVEKESGDD